MSAALGHFRSNLKNAWRNDRRAVLRGATAWALFGAIIIVFVFWGLTPHHQGVMQGGAAAQVNDQFVSFAEYSEQLEMLSRDPRFAQLQQLGGDFAHKYMQQQAIQSLIDQRLLGENLGKLGMVAADAQIRDTIMEIPAFQENGRFSKTRYYGYLQATRQDAGAFEEKLRRQLAVGHAVRAFSSALRPLPFEQERVKSVADKKINAEVVSVPTDKLVIPETLGKADVKAFLAKADSTARIKTYYETHKSEFSTAEKAKVRHILIKAEKGNAAALAKAKASAEEILAKLEKGADFAQMAKEKSEDPGSKSSGGVIDYFARGAMVPEFENYAFSGKIGQISKPIQTDYGFHVIKIEDRKAATDRKLEDVQEEIAETLLAQEKSREEIQGLEKALTDGKAQDVQAFVAKHRLQWVEVGNFSLNAENLPKVGGGDEAVTAAFRLTPEKPMASKLVRQGPQAYIIRYKAPAAEAKADKKGTKAPGVEANPALEAESQASRRSEEAFGQWMDGIRKLAKISVNPQLGANTAAADDQSN